MAVEVDQLTVRDHLVGAWIQTFDGKGAVRGVGVWDLSPNGSFAFRWRETNALVKMNFSSWSGEWDVSGVAPSRLLLKAKKVRAPIQYVVDAAYLANPATAGIAGFRALMVAVNHAGGNKLKGAAMSLQANVEGGGRKSDEVVLILDEQSFGKLSYWRVLLSEETREIKWHRFLRG
ncbi:hypothetical protein ACWCPS_00525 [Streptomyces mauvecolor]